MGGQRLPVGRRRLHHLGRPDSRPVWANTLIRRGVGIVCSCLADNLTLSERSHGHRRPRAAGFRCCIRRRRHAPAVTEGVAETERARAIGAWTGFLMLGFSIGPLIGGFLTHYGGWRSTFGFNVLIMIVSGLALWQHSRPARQSGYRLDWLGIGLLGLFMPMLISALQALPAAGASPRPALVLMTLASLSFAALLWVETRNARPLLDFGLFTNHNFGLASLLAFLLMFEIMTLLLYYNLFAQAPDGLGMSAITVGLSLVPLSVALFSFARMTPRITAALGMHKTMVGGSLLLAIGCTLAWASLAGFGFPALMLGLCLAGAGIALPYASAP